MIPDRSSRRRSRRRQRDLAMYAWLALMAITVALAGVAGGILLEREVLDTEDTDQAYEDVEAVGTLIEDNYYYRPQEGGDQAGFETSLERNAIDGMLSGLDDEYTRYLVPDEAQIASDELTGEYGGLGTTLVSDGTSLLVLEVNPGSPAERAGIISGDQITRIDNRPIDAGSLPGQQGDLRGPVGSTVNLTIKRTNVENMVTVEVTREAIVVHAVASQMLQGTSYYWIKILIFGDRTTEELDAALAEAQAQGATGIILDLRGNGGGWVTAAQETIGRFVPASAGPALYEDSDSGPGGETAFPILSPEAGPTSLPTIVLVNGGTASAAEIVAGALRDYDRALIIGEPTFGKGSVQRIFDFPDGASLRVTVAEWFTPSKGRIQGEGINPDLQLSGGAEVTLANDPYLIAATGLLEKGQSRPSDRIPDPQQATPQG